MVQLEIAAEVICNLLAEGKPLTRENLWPINKRYIDAQGRAFASQVAMLVGAVASSAAENDFFFEKDIIFSQKSFESMSEGKPLAFTTAELTTMVLKMLGGVIAGSLRISTIRALLKAMSNGNKVSALYEAYPETPEGFDDWCRRADAVWVSCGSMADALSVIKQ